MRVDKGTPILAEAAGSFADRGMGQEQNLQLRRAKYIAIDVFLVFHILAIACWCMPLDTPLVPLCRNLIRPYFLWSGLFQSWICCSHAKGSQHYVEAVVIYIDGSRKLGRFRDRSNWSNREVL